MENASKALIMAAGVLIGLLIISIAIFLFLNFSETSSTLHEQIRQDQISQFNTQFSKYVESDATIYDVVTVINIAKDNNEYYGLTQADASNLNTYYITVNFKGRRQENKTKSELDQLIKIDLNKITGREDSNNLKRYKCEVKINPNTDMVYLINFTEK